jgi:predicted PurR-regulated permease PerM
MEGSVETAREAKAGRAGPLTYVLVALGALLAWKLAGLLLLLFAAILLAIAFATLGEGLRRLAPLPYKLSIVLAAALVLGVLGAVVALYGWRIVGQAQAVIAKTSQSLHELLTWAQLHDWSRDLVQRASAARFKDATDALAPLLGSVLGATSRYIGYGLVVLVSAIFLALDGERYIEAGLLLAPPARRPLVREFVRRSGSILRRWLISRLIVMAAIGVLASVGLSLLGIPAALLLGLTGALLTFIPYLGAIFAAAPAVLVALTVSPLKALLTGLMFWGVHTIEGTFITPVVQDDQVYLPAVTTIFSTLAFAILFGPSGVIVASPLALLIIVAVRLFYVEDRLGEPPEEPPPPRKALFWISRPRPRTPAR